jgi:hypothetical protein
MRYLIPPLNQQGAVTFASALFVDVPYKTKQLTIKIITLHQPWASLIALRLKQYETRTFKTKYRGLIAIHAAKRPIDTEGWAVAYQADKLSGVEIKGSQIQVYGSIVAIAELTDCKRMVSANVGDLLEVDCAAFIDEQTELERTVGNWQQGRYAWKLQNILALPRSIACMGYQGMRDLPAELELEINLQINPSYCP